jgi:hypothetical protein
MFFKQKIETIPFREFLRPKSIVTEKEKSLKPTLPLYGLFGVDITPGQMFGISGFNDPFVVVFLVAGVAFTSALIERILLEKGYQRAAEGVETFTGILFPVAFYAFLIIGVLTLF